MIFVRITPGILPRIPLDMPITISLEFVTRIPSKITQGIYPATHLKISTENTYDIPSRIPIGFHPAISRKFFLAFLSGILSRQLEFYQEFIWKFFLCFLGGYSRDSSNF